MNIYDIAKKAGVSIATVSRVLNDNPNVSEKTREKVEKVLKEMNYTPSALGRGLAINSMRTIGILTIDIRDIYFATVIHTIEQEFSKVGYNVILCNTGGNLFEKKRYLNVMLQKKVDGVILVGSVFPEKSDNRHIVELGKEIPVVIVNGFVEGMNLYSILCNDRSATFSMVKYLYQKGHRNIAYLQDTDSFSSMAKVQGFEEGCRSCGISDGNIFRVGQGIDGGIAGARQVLDACPDVTAIMTGEDIVAAGVIKELTRRGKRIPGDMAVTGFNNSIFARCTHPELTTVDNKMEAMGIGAVRIMTDVLEGKNVSARTILTPDLVIGAST